MCLIMPTTADLSITRGFLLGCYQDYIYNETRQKSMNICKSEVSTFSVFNSVLHNRPTFRTLKEKALTLPVGDGGLVLNLSPGPGLLVAGRIQLEQGLGVPLDLLHGLGVGLVAVVQGHLEFVDVRLDLLLDPV